MKIKVTQDHIDAAKILRKDVNFSPQESCPIALALKTQGFPWAKVGFSVVRDLELNSSQNLPRKAIDFIYCYDSYYLVEPFEFEI